MRNITLDCPRCDAIEKVVGNPDETSGGSKGKWYCFECGAQGLYDISFSFIGEAEIPTDPPEAREAEIPDAPA